MTQLPPTVIGLDLSLTSTGVASSALWTDTVRPRAGLRGHARLRWIRDTVLELIPADPALVVVEGPSYGSQGGQAGHHERAGLWWHVTYALWARDVPCAVASPATRAKYATGKGNAAKADVVREVTRRFAWFGGGEDEADALVLAAMGADWLGWHMAAMPAVHRKALAAVKWPANLDAPVGAVMPAGPVPPHADEPALGVPVSTLTPNGAL